MTRKAEKLLKQIIKNKNNVVCFLQNEIAKAETSAPDWLLRGAIGELEKEGMLSKISWADDTVWLTSLTNQGLEYFKTRSKKFWRWLTYRTFAWISGILNAILVGIIVWLITR